ncbi:hypothetical protein BZG01_08900 [Labilibaculum manganireducens]|uniref:Uncharacterized protein n=1 Tax=Labilibaculum manganireducens TaxID=1940525 RepID=A0A2N3I9D7_9BACT|nr:hypothetical protein BZG01_08900 [Labilibaculum manganireducens]
MNLNLSNLLYIEKHCDSKLLYLLSSDWFQFIIVIFKNKAVFPYQTKVEAQFQISLFHYITVKYSTKKMIIFQNKRAT